MMPSPTPADVLRARQALGITQTEAAALLNAGRVTWARYESGARHMSAVEWAYFRHVSGVEKIPFIPVALGK